MKQDYKNFICIKIQVIQKMFITWFGKKNHDFYEIQYFLISIEKKIVSLRVLIKNQIKNSI